MTPPAVLCPGDEFAVHSSEPLGWAINCVQKAKAADNESTFNHTGVILTSDATTIEAKWTVKQQNLWEAYRGKRCLVVRNISMDQHLFAAGYAKIEKHLGQRYPVHRLVLHLLGLAKWVHWDRVVCSELTAKFEVGCAEYLGLDVASGFMTNHYGVNPDHLTDRWRISRYYQTIFEGIIEG